MNLLVHLEEKFAIATLQMQLVLPGEQGEPEQASPRYHAINQNKTRGPVIITCANPTFQKQ